MSVGKLPSEIGAKKGECVALPEGWKEQTYYVVEVSFGSHNPIHRAILYVGFINQMKGPLSGAYSNMFQATWEPEVQHPHEAYYIKAICEIKEMSDGL